MTLRSPNLCQNNFGPHRTSPSYPTAQTPTCSSRDTNLGVPHIFLAALPIFFGPIINRRRPSPSLPRLHIAAREGASWCHFEMDANQLQLRARPEFPSPSSIFRHLSRKRMFYNQVRRFQQIRVGYFKNRNHRLSPTSNFSDTMWEMGCKHSQSPLPISHITLLA